jgi:hypothetical protein
LDIGAAIGATAVTAATGCSTFLAARLASSTLGPLLHAARTPAAMHIVMNFVKDFKKVLQVESTPL